MNRSILKYEIISSGTIDGLIEKVNKIMRGKPDYKPQGGIAVIGHGEHECFYQAMVRPLDKGELDFLEDQYNHFG